MFLSRVPDVLKLLQLVGNVVHLHGRRQRSDGQKQQRPSLRMAVAHYSLTALMQPAWARTPILVAYQRA